jgi:predicted negative regulator of RcsB-dependent stress response
VWQKIKSWYQENGCWLIEEVMRWLFIVIFVFFVVLALYLIWEKLTAEPVTTMSQQQAETPTGVQKAADNASVTLDTGQAKDVSTAIKEIRVTEKEPVYVVQTTGENAKAESEKVVKQEQADFAIVTDKDDPEKKVNLNELDKDTKVELNQYNIQAFKKQLNTIEYQPTEKVVGYTHQWKVTDSGRYIGVGVDYDLDDKKVYAKITYSW